MVQSSQSERRRVQRVRLLDPLRASVDGVKAFVVDISLSGVRVMHQDELRTARECTLRTEWDSHPLELRCRVVRTTLHQSANASGRALYHSGMEILSMSEMSAMTLRKLIEHHVERALDEQKANARGIPPPHGAAQSMRTGAPQSFVRHELSSGRWREINTPVNAQPEHGFTIAAHTTRAEVEMLRRAYEAASSQSERVMIRRLAALSVSSNEVVQARRYLP